MNGYYDNEVEQPQQKKRTINLAGDYPPRKTGYMPKGTEAELDDMSPMPFGKFKGKKMKDVPVDYLHWLWHEGCRHSGVKSYIERNLDALKMENKDLIWKRQ
jgi:uncharacterized protein (DUF3820 family)